MAGRKWTRDGENLLRDNYGKVPVKVLAKELGRTEKSVHMKARGLGLNTKRDMKAVRERERQVRKYHAKGWSDSEVAAATGIDRRLVTEIRSRLGLKAHGRSERYRKRVAENTRRQLKEAGAKSLAEIKWNRFRETQAPLGWPEGLSIRATQILDLLYYWGPMTRRQICEATGMPFKGRHTFKSNRVPGQSYLTELQRSGLVVSLPRAVKRTGKGRSEGLYMVALGVEPCQREETSQSVTSTDHLSEKPELHQCRAG